MQNKQRTAIGIDACKKGWIVARLIDNRIEFDLYAELSQAILTNEDAENMFIDMPIGLPETLQESLSRPEQMVRKMLPKKASSVFNVPCRQAIYEDTYERSNEQNKYVVKKGLSKQSFYISKKCRELDCFLKDHPQFMNKLLEAHPELQFARFSKSKQPILLSKKTEMGIRERLNLITSILNEHFNIQIDIMKEPLFKKYSDDVVDALCLAVAARLSLTYGYKRLPEEPFYDSRGLRMQMIYFDI